MGQVTLPLTPATRDTLRSLLAVSTELGEGARVVDYLPVAPWGDLDEFRRRVYEPLRLSAPPSEGSANSIEVTSDDARLIWSVLQGLAESFSGGVPWSPLSRSELEAVNRCLAALDELP
jgi:hypothetical protein